MKLLAVSIVMLLTLASLGALIFFQDSNLSERLLVEQIKQEIKLPQSFWENTDIKFFYMEPYTDFWSEKKGIRAGTVIRDNKSEKDVIHLNRYLLALPGYSYQERVSLLKETLAHEAGHVLSGMAVGEKAYELKQKYWRELGKKFERPCIEDFGVLHCFSNLWEYREEEAFADIVRIVICPSCSQKPETAVILTRELKDLVQQIIVIALSQKTVR